MALLLEGGAAFQGITDGKPYLIDFSPRQTAGTGGAMRVLIVFAYIGVSAISSAAALDGGAGLASIISRVAPKGATTTIVEQGLQGVLVTGRLKGHDQVAEFMRALASLVSTPSGIAQVVERNESSSKVRVKLLDAVTIRDFAASEVLGLEVELLRADSKRGKVEGEFIEFEIRVRSRR